MIETLLNIGSGFIISLVVWQILAWHMGIPMPFLDNLYITSIFTVVAITRSYIWRRLFNNGLHIKVVNFARRFEHV